MRRLLGELGVTKPARLTAGIASMDYATATTVLLATPFAASLLPLTLRLLPVITRIAQLIVAFRADEPTPSTCYHFEIPGRHGFWGRGHRYPPRDAEINRFCNQQSWYRC